ncbi:hypothetical protein CCMA1212_001761 [Trichoderma ghanense]|uniref:Uncharacterized protein n=1 Tax=Trichoderma ghanense TaxID=65468 RepID=A0ABY2HE36_9HYPO
MYCGSVDAALHPPSIATTSVCCFDSILSPRQGGYSCCLRLLHNDVVLHRDPAQTATIFFFSSLLFHLLLCSIRCPIRPSGSRLGIRRGRRASLWGASESIKSMPTQRGSCLAAVNGQDPPDLAATSTPLPLPPRPDSSPTGSRQPGATSRNSTEAARRLALRLRFPAPGHMKLGNATCTPWRHHSPPRTCPAQWSGQC